VVIRMRRRKKKKKEGWVIEWFTFLRAYFSDEALIGSLPSILFYYLLPFLPPSLPPPSPHPLPLQQQHVRVILYLFFLLLFKIILEFENFK